MKVSSEPHAPALWMFTQPPIQNVLVLFPRGQVGRGVNLTTQLHQVLRVRIRGAIATSKLPSWECLVNYRTNITLCHKIRYVFESSWLEHYATNRKVTGSIPDVIAFFKWPNPSSRTMSLGSTQPLTETGTRDLSGVKGVRCVRLTSPPPVNRLSLTVGASMSHNPMGFHDLLHE
jgi:hypothetical protein